MNAVQDKPDYKIMTKIFRLYFLLLYVCLPVAGFSQIKVPMNGANWEVRARNAKFEKYQGFDSIYAEGGQAALKNVNFLDGTIEFDVFMQNVFSFPGVTFRMQDDLNFEEFYLRPFESGKEDAVQYSPVFNGVSGWQLYTGEGFTKTFDFPANQWLHVKIVIGKNYGEIFLGEEKIPMIISELKREPKAGKISLTLDNAHFANFSYATDKPIVERKTAIPKIQPPETVVSSWLISGVFKESELEGKYILDDKFVDSLNWTKLSIENSNGLINLARIGKKDKENNTVFAEITINSDKDQIKRLSTGFSDRMKIYFNDRLIYGGNDGFRTRDFRFLGTIGYFDDVYLPLVKGRNILMIAVSENFGGWGLQGKFADVEGISFTGN